MSNILRYLSSFYMADRGADEPSGLIQNEDGTVTLILPNGSRVPLTGGGGLTVAQEIILGDNVSVANGDAGSLTWDTVAAGDEILDLTDPSLPVIATAGTYMFVAAINSETITAGGSYQAVLEDNTGAINSTQDSASSDVGNGGVPTVTLTGIGLLEIGGSLSLNVTNHDGVAAVNFKILQATILKLS